jgi:hypothetical protein
MTKGGNREIVGGDLLAFHFAFAYTIALLQRVSKFCAKELIYNKGKSVIILSQSLRSPAQFQMTLI